MPCGYMLHVVMVAWCGLYRNQYSVGVVSRAHDISHYPQARDDCLVLLAREQENERKLQARAAVFR